MTGTDSARARAPGQPTPAPHCGACYHARQRGGHLRCHLNPKPEQVAPDHWCSHYADGPITVTEAEVEAAMRGNDRALVRAALLALKALSQPR